MKVIDTHAHFWNVDKFRYPWIETGSFFNRNFLLDDYQRAAQQVPIEKIVFVECDCHAADSFNEAKWVEELAGIDLRIKGIVAHLELTDTKNFDASLEKIASVKLLKGIRHNIQHTAKGFCLQESFIQGIKKVHQKGFHFELCITHDQLEETIELVKQCPEVRFVLDHCAKPGIKAGDKEPWMTHMWHIAQNENVVCKISGLLTEADWENWTPGEVLFYMDYAADVFGHSRIMFGSDWPVNEAAGGYNKWYELTLALTQAWSNTEKENFYYNNANIFYRL